MVATRLVRDIKTGRRYKLTTYIAAGATAAVYEAVEEPARDPTRPERVAVKIALEVKRAGIFDDEVRLIQQIREYSGGQFVVDARYGQDENDPNRPVLIMDLVPKEWWIFRQVRDKPLDEAVSLSLARQYAELLTIVHDQLHLTTGDRKGGDIYWDPSRGSLLVLDWNVTRRRPNEPLDEQAHRQDATLVCADIHNFARFWYQFVIGEGVRDVPEIDPAPGQVPERWRMLARGTRRLLRQALNSRPGAGYSTAADLGAAVERFAPWLNQPVEQIVQEAERLQHEGDGQDPIERRELVADLVDLVLRDKPNEAQKQRAEMLAQWAGEREKAAREAAEKEFASARHDLDQGHYPRLIDRLTKARDITGLTTLHRLQIERWIIVARALQKGNDAGMAMKDFRPGLVAGVEALEANGLDEASHTLAEVIRKLVSEGATAVGESLQVIQDEVAIRKTVAAAEAGERQASGVSDEMATDLLEDAARRYQEVMASLGTIARTAPEYSHALVTTLPPVADRIAAIKVRVERDKRSRAELEQRRTAAEEVRSLLHDALSDNPPNWPDMLHTVLGRLDMQEWPSMARLRDVDRLMQHQEYRLAIDAVSSLIKDDPNWEPAREANTLCLRVSQRKAIQLVGQARWPDEVREAVSLFDALQKRGSNPDNRLYAQLQEKAQAQRDLMERIGVLKSNPRHELDASDYDQALQEAQQLGIELFERSREDGKQIWVRDVLALRDVARFQRQADRLGQSLSSLTSSLSSHTTNMRNVADEVGQLEAKLSEAQARLDEFAFDDRRLNDLLQRVQQLTTFSQSLQNPQLSLASAETTIAALETKAEALRGRLAQATESVASMETQARSLEQRIGQIDAPQGGYNLTGDHSQHIQKTLEQREQEQREGIKRLFDQLEKLRLTNDRPETLPQFEQIIDELWNRHGLNRKELGDLDEWNNWRIERARVTELLVKWQKLTAQFDSSPGFAENLNTMLDETEQLASSPIGSLPRDYWGELATHLMSAWRNFKAHSLSQSGVTRYGAQLTRLYLLHARILSCVEEAQGTAQSATAGQISLADRGKLGE